VFVRLQKIVPFCFLSNNYTFDTHLSDLSPHRFRL